MSIVLSCTLAYNGAPFAGFARQPGQLTVQGSFEEALALLFRHDVETVCAGRTDAGVHARAQVVSFELGEEEYAARSSASMLRSLNALTHESISVRSVEQRPSGFSARFSAKMREYRYFVCVEPTPPVFMRNFSWHQAKGLDVAAMFRASRVLIGEHDFKSFCTAASAEGKVTQRFVESIDFFDETLLDERCLCIRVRGNAFLHSMVRTMVGTLAAVGRHQRDEAWVEQVLAARLRSAAGENAPACGLVLWNVDY